MQSGSYRADGDAAMAGSFNAATRKIHPLDGRMSMYP
jgi:hypothetical protein